MVWKEVSLIFIYSSHISSFILSIFLYLLLFLLFFSIRYFFCYFSLFFIFWSIFCRFVHNFVNHQTLTYRYQYHKPSVVSPNSSVGSGRDFLYSLYFSTALFSIFYFFFCLLLSMIVYCLSIFL